MNLRSVAEAALYYLSLGWSVIPAHPRNKCPAIRWQEYQHRRPTVEEVRSWFRDRPHTNIGIVTGKVSGLVVLDVDLKHGGEESLSNLTNVNRPLPQTVDVRTGGGGRHIYFAHPGKIIPNKVGLSKGIDLRGDGGYVIAPPSVHPSGNQYMWVATHEPQVTALASMPPWLLREITGDAEHVGHPLNYWRRLVHEGIAQGERNNTLASLTGHLLWHGVDPDIIVELLLCWNAVRCRPPLSESEVIRTVDSITRTHRRAE